MSPDQAWGGSTTYHRRYDAMMLLGLFCSDDPTDNDGEVIETKKAAVVAAKSNDKYISEKQVGLLLGKTNDRPELRTRIMEKLQIKDLKFIEKSKFNSILEWLDKNISP